MQHILPQGRCVWVNPAVKTETEDFEDVSFSFLIFTAKNNCRTSAFCFALRLLAEILMCHQG